MPRNSNFQNQRLSELYAPVIQNNFIAGLNTQATALNFPANAVIDQDNCIFSERGIVSRRYGVDFENNYVTNTQDRTNLAQSTFYWKNASGDGTTNLVVQQNGGTLTFYDTNAKSSLSEGIISTTIALSSYQSSGSTTDNLNQNECQYATGLGYLFVVHPYCDPFYIQYNPSTNDFTSSIISFTTRDVYGITETGLVNTEPTSLTDNHEYNLLNQGWTVDKINTFANCTSTPSAPTLSTSTTGGSIASGTVYVKITYVNAAGETLPSLQATQATTGSTSTVTVAAPVNPSSNTIPSVGNITGYNVYAAETTSVVLQNTTPIPYSQSYTITSLVTGTASPPTTNTAIAYPSNAEVWWTFNDANNLFNPASMYLSVGAGSSPAPQGFFRLNPWNTERATVCTNQAGVTLTLTGSGIDTSSGTIRPTATAFFAGRVWYSGVNAPGYNGLVYFTRVVQDKNDFGWCAATNDPTSQTLFNFVPSDGGIISIPEAGTIYKMIPLGPNLIVFGAHGVWAITGSSGVGFAADNYNVANLSYMRSISTNSYVVADGNIYWWNDSDINILTQGQTGYVVESISYNTIKDFYISIPLSSIKLARGDYNPRTHIIQWLYTSKAASDLTSTYTFDRVLSFNLLSKAFYTWTVDTTQASINSIVVIEGAGSVVGTSTIVDAASDTVVDASGDTVDTFQFAQSQVETVTKYLCSYPSSGSYKFTFAEAIQNTFHDWVYLSGVDYSSYFTTGYLVLTQGERRFQSNYIYVFNDLTNITTDGANSYTFQAKWDYGNVGNSGMWTQKQTISQTIVHNETNYSASRRRLKVRGNGISLQFSFYSVTGKPFAFVGWSTYDTSNAQP